MHNHRHHIQTVKERLSDWHWWFDWAGIFIGSTIMAAGFVFFINPYNIVPGGVYGASIVLHNLFPTIQVGTFGYCFDIPLLILSVLLLGAQLGSRTIVAAMTTPSIMNLMSALAYPTQEALEALDPTLIAGGRLDMSSHLMLTCLIGSTLIGLGCGIVVRSKATTGGSDIIAMIIQKYLKIPFSTAVFLVDAVVVCFGFAVIGLGIFCPEPVADKQSCLLSFYSLIAIWVSSRVIARVIAGSKDNKILFIISSLPSDDLHDYILNDLERTATCIKSSGLYTHGEKEMLFLVVRDKEIPGVKDAIREADPHAFVVVTDAYDTFGEGWKQLPKSGEITPQ